MTKLLIATRRQGKFKEIKDLLKQSKLELLSLTEINFQEIEPEENGQTFFENASLKAKFYGKKAVF